MPDKVPTPPEGYMTIHSGGALHELPSNGPFRVSDDADMRYRTPIEGVLVYAEGDWRPVTAFRARFRRSVELDYTGSPLADAQVHKTYGQRVVAERVAVRPDVIPQWIGMQENEAQRLARAAQIREEREAACREQVERAAAARTAREAAMTPEQRRSRLQSELAVAELRVEDREEQVTAAQTRLAEARARVDELRRQLDTQDGEGAS